MKMLWDKKFAWSAMTTLIILLCLASTANTDENGHQPVRFAIIGDRTGSEVPGIYDQIIEEIQRMRPDLIMTVGDQIEGYTDDTIRLNKEWSEYKQVLKPLTMPIHFTPGNHDILSDVQEGIFRSQIGDPFYSFHHCDIHFIVLDNGRWEKSEDLPSEQIAWLISDLEQNRDSKHTVVFMHKPFWFNTTAAGKPDTLHTLFRTFGVDAVFTGHFHIYFSGMYDGIKYTTIGSSGGGTDPGPTGLLYHFCWVTVDDNEIAIAPIKMGAVLPWNELTADDLHLENRIRNFSLEFEPLMLNQSLQPISNEISLKIHNQLPGKELADTIRWETPAGWSIDPEIMPVNIAPGKSMVTEFQVSRIGDFYPLPTAELQIWFAEGKQAIAGEPMRVARTMACKKVSMPPMIDGNIAEPIWKNPERLFFSPDGGEMITDSVDFFFAYDENNLYLAARCKEMVMDSLAASVVDHDGPIYSEDCVGLFLQPDIKKDIAYQIYFNPIGFVFDQKLVMNETGYMDADREWNGNYDIKTIHGPDFWTVEVAIPLIQFGTGGEPGKKMGLNFRRKQARLGSSSDWQVPIDYNPKSFGILIME